jgi:hypothetical protein
VGESNRGLKVGDGIVGAVGGDEKFAEADVRMKLGFVSGCCRARRARWIQHSSIGALSFVDLFEGEETVADVGVDEIDVVGFSLKRLGPKGGKSHLQGEFELLGLAGEDAEAEEGGLRVRVNLQCVAIGDGGLEQAVFGVVLTGGRERRWCWR